MTDNTPIDNAWKHHEENNPETAPELDGKAEKLDRHNGKITTSLGDGDITELMSKI